MPSPAAAAPAAMAELRREYKLRTLDEREVRADPLAQFEAWFAEAQAAGLDEPNAMTLATATAGGAPSARIVLLKGVDARGFQWYTNYDSRKGRELAENPRAALVFLWQPIERQVRITGTVSRLGADESFAYFATRPRLSRIGAWASAQSSPLADRAALERQFEDATARFEGTEPPLPPAWGGYVLAPEEIEFWQGRRSRLHDRILYTRHGDGWRIARLAP